MINYKTESSYGLQMKNLNYKTYTENKVTKDDEDESLIFNQESVVGDIKNSNAYKVYKDFFKRVDYSSNKNFIIPGLTSSMVPQGMCDTKDYILISAYDKGKINNSCIYLIEKSTGKLIKTVYLYNSKSHVGGIACDGRYVWVGNGKEGTVSKLLLSEIINSKDGDYIKHYKHLVKNEKGEKVRPTFATYSNGVLWLGQFEKSEDSYVYGYDTSSANSPKFKLTSKYKINIPKQIQGITFDKLGRLILSQSYGRNFDSRIYIYDNLDYNLKDNVYHGILSTPTIIKAPPTSENIFVGDDNLLYVLFESAADFYRNGRDNKGKAQTPVDRVCPINLQ